TLLPAVRRGGDYVRDNGSPWPWPLYPWALFGLLALAVPGRAFLLCWSFHLLDGTDRDASIFGAYFLLPFGLALAVLLLEAVLSSGRRAPLLLAFWPRSAWWPWRSSATGPTRSTGSSWRPSLTGWAARPCTWPCWPRPASTATP